MFDPLTSKAKVLVLTTVAFLFGLGLASGMGWTGDTHAMPVLDDQPRLSQETTRAAVEFSDAFVSIAETVTPAVVRIQTQSARSSGQGRQQIPEPFRRFFDPEQRGPEGEQRELPPQISGGSGFIVSEDGYIVTNNHVVEGADEITVRTRDRREFRAEVVGSDPTTDLAVIKIEADGLPTMSLGSAENTRVGEWVVAVGNPGIGGAGQLDYTVTAGIVSAKGRPLQIINRSLLQDPDFNPEMAGYAIENFIQTDAVINPGNSGGPLVNLQGQVVGVNSAIVSRSGFYQGYGFAIPIDLARRVMEDLIEYGRVRRAWLGVSITGVGPVDAEAYGLPDVSGVLVQDFPANSPAEEAGIQREDVIVAVNGREVDTPSQLQSRVAQLAPGQTARIRVYRDGEPRTVEVELGEAPFSREPERTTEREGNAEQRLGIAVQSLTEDAARELGYDNTEGVVISGVQPGGPAWERGLPPGWKILEINDQEVRSPSDVEAILSDVEGGSIVKFALTNPDGASRVVNVRMPRE